MRCRGFGLLNPGMLLATSKPGVLEMHFGSHQSVFFGHSITYRSASLAWKLWAQEACANCVTSTYRPALRRLQGCWLLCTALEVV